MVSAHQRSADFFVRYAIIDADRQGVTGPLETFILRTIGLIIRHTSCNGTWRIGINLYVLDTSPPPIIWHEHELLSPLMGTKKPVQHSLTQCWCNAHSLYKAWHMEIGGTCWHISPVTRGGCVRSHGSSQWRVSPRLPVLYFGCSFIRWRDGLCCVGRLNPPPSSLLFHYRSAVDLDWQYSRG